MAMGLIAFLFGTFLFVRTCVDHWENTILLIVIVVMVVGYCLEFKQWVIINQILLAVSHVLLPYFMVKIDGDVTTFGLLDWVLILTFFAYAYTGQIVHESIDGDAITRFSLRTQQIIVWVSSFITIGMGIVANFVLWSMSTPDWYIFMPMIFIPLGTLYIFRRPKQSPKGVKDLGNILLLYFLVFIFRQMWA
jgi:4-hydroxybenzoate polyprenyltransferase